MTTLKDEALRGLLAKAEKATQGEWEVIESTRGDWPSLYVRPTNDGGIVAQIMAGVVDGQYRLNAAFIAAANPATITALITETLSLSARLAQAEEALAREREECANLATNMPDQEIRLHCGELTTQEMRFVKAVLGWLAAAIRARSQMGGRK